MPLEAIHPGATAFTRIGAHSSAAVSVKLRFPARAALRLHPTRVAFARKQKTAGEVVAHHRVPTLGADLFQRREN